MARTPSTSTRRRTATLERSRSASGQTGSGSGARSAAGPSRRSGTSSRHAHAELDRGLRTSATYTVRQAVDDWLEGGLPGRSERTRSIYREALPPLLERSAQAAEGADGPRCTQGTRGARRPLSTRYLQIAKASLARAIRYAEAHDLVGRNVATLVDAPKGQVGRPSRSLTLEQSLALLEAARGSRLNAYVVLSITVGVRTEEARELRWDHVDLDGGPGAVAARPALVALYGVRFARAATPRRPSLGGRSPARDGVLWH